MDEDGETLHATDVIVAAELAERQEERDHRPLAERAVADRDWTYGHLVVDETRSCRAHGELPTSIREADGVVGDVG